MSEYENVRKAIDVMTAWATDNPNETGFSMDRLTEYVSEGPESEAGLMMGLISFAGYALTKLEKESGKPMQWHIQDIALRLANK
jgi:hypothetical protein